MAIGKIMSEEMAETLALQVLQFLVSAPEHITAFLAVSGTNPDDLQEIAGNSDFLRGVLEFLLADESLLFLFAEHVEISPDVPAAAHRALVGREDNRNA